MSNLELVLYIIGMIIFIPLNCMFWYRVGGRAGCRAETKKQLNNEIIEKLLGPFTEN